jgi:hypothetical protein
MAYCFYNGVKLPELPSTTLANYPYCWIRKNDNTQHYDLIFTKVLGYYDATAGGIVYGANEGTAEIVHYRVAYPGNADDWTNYQTTNTWMALDVNRTVMWSNHYIPNGSPTATVMYFDAHEAIPEAAAYQIERATLVGIADQVRRVCDLETDLTPAEMEQNLRELNVDLMETYVVSGPVEQVIYPDNGCCGFSKVTVGAVDISGGGDYPGGGDSGGYPDGGDSVILPDVNDNEYGSEDNYTGYTYYNLALLPTFPAEELAKYPYALLSWDKYEEHYTMYLSPGPFRVQTSAGLNPPSVTGRGPHNDGSPGNTSQRYDQVGGTWSKRSSMGGYGFYKEDIFWANHTICYDNTGEPFYYGFSAIPQASKDSSGTEQYSKVSDSEMNALAVSAQNITGTTETMNMRQVITELDAYANDTWEGGSY